MPGENPVDPNIDRVARFVANVRKSHFVMRWSKQESTYNIVRILMSQDITNEAFNSEQIQSDDAVHTNLEATRQAAPSSAVEAGLNDSDASRESALSRKSIIVKVSSLKDLDHPGLPPPLTGPRLEALKASIIGIGLIQPVIIDEENRVISGRSRVSVHRELGIAEIRAIRVSSKDAHRIAMGSAVVRQWSPLEVAGSALWTLSSDELESYKKKEPKVKTNVLISRLMAGKLGMVRGTSPRQITKYLKLARSYPNLQSQKEKEAVEAAATLNEAFKLLPREGKKRGKQDPSTKFHRTLARFEKELEAMGQADVVKDAIETIRSAVAKVVALNA